MRKKTGRGLGWIFGTILPFVGYRDGDRPVSDAIDLGVIDGPVSNGTVRVTELCAEWLGLGILIAIKLKE